MRGGCCCWCSSAQPGVTTIQLTAVQPFNRLGTEQVPSVGFLGVIRQRGLHRAWRHSIDRQLGAALQDM